MSDEEPQVANESDVSSVGIVPTPLVTIFPVPMLSSCKVTRNLKRSSKDVTLLVCVVIS